MNIVDRIKAPTPKFFKKVRTVGLILASVSASILAAPLALPAVVVQIAGYLAVAGSVATAVSQVATMEGGTEPEEKEKEVGMEAGGPELKTESYGD